MTDNTNFKTQFLDFIKAVASEFQIRYTKEESNDKFLSKESAESIYETKENAQETKDEIENTLYDKADEAYVKNRFLSIEEELADKVNFYSLESILNTFVANSADKLNTPIKINQTSFDGSKNIVTEAWGKPRQIVLKDSAEKNFTTVTDFDGTTNLKLILPSSAYFKDLSLDGTLTCKRIVVLEPEEGEEPPIVNIINISSDNITTNNITSENITVNTFNSTNLNSENITCTGELTVSGSANLDDITCNTLTASSIIRGDVIQSTHNYTTSDERLKNNIHKIKLRESYSFGPCSFNYLNEDKVSVGLIAQDVLKDFPEAIYTNQEGYLSIDYPAIVALLCGRINRLEKRIK